jgi:hypothetical protein
MPSAIRGKQIQARMQGMKSLPFFRPHGLSIEIRNVLRIPQILRCFDFFLRGFLGKWWHETCHDENFWM